MKTKLAMIEIKIVLWFICWLIAITNWFKESKEKRRRLKSYHRVALTYKLVFWAYLVDMITKEDHDELLAMYFKD